MSNGSQSYSNVIVFPTKTKNKLFNVAYRVPLYGDEQIKIVVASLNLCGDVHTAVTEYTLKTQDPQFIIECLRRAYVDDMFSSKAKAIVAQILAQIEEVKVRRS